MERIADNCRFASNNPDSQSKGRAQFGETTWHRSIRALSHRTATDPFLDWLKDLRVWDGVHRIDHFITDIFDVPQGRAPRAHRLGWPAYLHGSRHPRAGSRAQTRRHACPDRSSVHRQVDHRRSDAPPRAPARLVRRQPRLLRYADIRKVEALLGIRAGRGFRDGRRDPCRDRAHESLPLPHQRQVSPRLRPPKDATSHAAASSSAPPTTNPASPTIRPVPAASSRSPSGQSTTSTPCATPSTPTAISSGPKLCTGSATSASPHG